MPGRIRRSATPASANCEPYTKRTSRGPKMNVGIAVARATARVVRVRTDAIRPASAFGSTARLNMTVPSALGTYHSVSASPLVTE